MSSEARVALSRLVAALEHHLEMANNVDVVSPAMLEDAELRLQDAFFTYDDILFTTLGTELPLELVDDFADEDDFDVQSIEDEDEDGANRGPEDREQDSVADLLDKD